MCCALACACAGGLLCDAQHEVREASAVVLAGFLRLHGPPERLLTLKWARNRAKKGKPLAERHAGVLGARQQATTQTFLRPFSFKHAPHALCSDALSIARFLSAGEPRAARAVRCARMAARGDRGARGVS